MSLFISNNTFKSVKALIYNSEGKILLQQRDIKRNLKWPGAWNLFGGMVEENESFNKAITRELIEEIGCVPGKIENEIFQWKNEIGILDKCFPIKFLTTNSDLNLKEGRALKWFDPIKLVNINKTPFLEHNVSKIINFFKDNRKNIVQEFEDEILKSFDLKKKNDRVFYTKKNVNFIMLEQVKSIKELAKLKSLPLVRICLHNQDNDKIHEMIMIHTMPQKVGPLKQERNASLSYHAIEGNGIIKLYSDNGKVVNNVKIDSNNLKGFNFCRLKANQFRSIESLSQYFIFLEVCSGPFKDEDTIWMKNIP